MLKKISSLIVLVGGILLAQTNDLQKNKIQNNPKSIEESYTKAIIKANTIEEYIQEYYTKTYYNNKGYLTEKDFYNETGELLFKEKYSYDTRDLLDKIEGKNETNTLTILKIYDYFEGGFKETITENDVKVKEIIYHTNSQNQVIDEEETTFLNTELVINRTHQYQGNNLIQTKITYGKDGYIIQYKYDKDNLPIEEVIYDLKNILLSKKRRKFDDKNNIVEENIFDNNGKLKTNNRISYMYDSNNNWTTRTQYANKIDQPISNTKRTIKY